MTLRWRTTIRVQDDLYRRAKSRAAAGGRALGEFIEDAIRDALASPPSQPADLPDLPVHGGEGLMPGVDLSSHAALLDLMDEADPLRCASLTSTLSCTPTAGRRPSTSQSSLAPRGAGGRTAAGSGGRGDGRLPSRGHERPRVPRPHALIKPSASSTPSRLDPRSGASPPGSATGPCSSTSAGAAMRKATSSATLGTRRSPSSMEHHSSRPTATSVASRACVSRNRSRACAPDCQPSDDGSVFARYA